MARTPQKIRVKTRLVLRDGPLCGFPGCMKQGNTIDHDHKCCSIGCNSCRRGLLCEEHNQAVGHYETVRDIRDQCEEYLNTHSPIGSVRN